MATHAQAPAFGVALRGRRARRRVSQLELAVRSGTTQRLHGTGGDVHPDRSAGTPPPDRRTDG